MVNSISSLNATVLSSLFGTAADPAAGTTIGLDASVITAWAAAKAGITDTVSLGADPNAPTPPWTPGYTPADAALASSALSGKAFFDPKAARYADLTMGDDYRQLFALYQGLETMSALAANASGGNLNAAQLAKTQAAFARGVAELQAYLAQSKFSNVNVAAGDRVDSATTTLGIAMARDSYTTGQLVSGSLVSTIPGLPANAKFDIVALTASGANKRVTIDLAQMGSLPRSIGSIVSFINSKLTAAGLSTRFSTVNQAPATQKVVIGGKTVDRPYTGPQMLAIQVTPHGGEKISFEAAAAQPAFYVTSATSTGGKLTKLEDASGAAGQPQWLTRPQDTSDPIGALLAPGFMGADLQSPPATASETRTTALMADTASNTETLLRAAGEATLNVRLADGRTISVTTGWRAQDQEGWRVLPGQTEDQGVLSDLSERLTQLLHEQGVQAGAKIWTDADHTGLSFFTGDGVTIAGLTISGRAINLAPADDPGAGYVGGLRAGVFARSFETGSVADDPDTLFKGVQTLSFTQGDATLTAVVDGGVTGIAGYELIDKWNAQLRQKGVAAAVSFVDDGAGGLKLHVDSTHAVSALTAAVNGAASSAALLAPGAWVNGGLPVAAPGEPFGDNIRTYVNAGASPFLANAGALDIAIVVATATGDKTVTVQVSAQERVDNPDAAPGQWNDLFQQRLNTALYQAGVYVESDGGDLSRFKAAEGAGQRIASVTVNGQAVSYAADAPAFGVGGAFDASRSFTSAAGAASENDDAQALIDAPSVSISFNTVWGAKTVSAALQPGDPPTLANAAVRLNEALAAAGYDLGVAAVPLAGGGASLRAAVGASATITGVSAVAIGAEALAATLDPIDAATHGADPVGVLAVSDRAARDAAVIATSPYSGTAIYQAPAANAAGWFAGRDFETTLGAGAKVLATRAVAAGPDGAVYVLADVSGVAGDQPVKGQSDVALFKYDSAGKLLFTRTLGGAASAQGFALAVSSTGEVAIAGAVSGALSGAGTEAGGADSFVALYDSDGQELWTQRRGASQDDSVSNIAFAANGSVIVTGVAAGALSGQAAQGGVDAYVRGFSATGGVLFTKQFGTSGDDSASALLVQDGPGGQIQITTGGVENNRGVLHSFTYSPSAGFASGASRDIGNFYGGAITTLAADSAGAIYVGGAVGADRLTVANTARGASAGKEGFVARLDADLTSASQDRVTYLGSAQDDSVAALAFADGALYALGQSGGVLAGVGGANIASTFLARLDDDGAVAWARSFNAGAANKGATSLAVAPQGASVLDRLGLPTGVLQSNDSTALVDRTSLRVGDEFTLSTDKGVAHRITINASDTLQTLQRKIDSYLGAAGAARIVTANGVQRIEIDARSGHSIRLGPGGAGKDALRGLGLPEGIVAAKTAPKGVAQTFGLGLISGELSLKDADAIAKTKADLAAATSIIRQAYEALANPHPVPQTAAQKAAASGGAVPQYLTDRLNNYRAALARLGG